MSTVESEIPRGNAAGFVKYFKSDFISGFQVFLIALPLCLGISLACGYPPMAGIFTAIIGSILTTFISNSEMTIKGPAAGLIVIAIGCVEDFSGNGFLDNKWTDADLSAYQAALAIGVAAAVLQIIFGLLRAGILGEFFPVSAVHGMLAAIGVIIIAKQLPVVLGVSAKGEPLELLKEIPKFITEANPAIATIGVVSLLIMFLWPFARKSVSFLKAIPAPLVVVLVAVGLGMAFDLVHKHSYVLQGHQYQLGEQYLVDMSGEMFGMFDEVTFPAFDALRQPKAWKWVFMFFIIGTLESLLSAKAVDIIDPYKRKSSMDRDTLAVGVANLCCALVGGLPMISEIVRSRANIDNGAKTRFADLWHGVFLLVCVALIPMVLHLIPLAALAAMLVYTGYRLAHPSEFIHVYHIGREQLIIFVSTLVGVLAIDLLWGIAIGIGVKMLIHVMNGVPLKSLFKTYLEVEQKDEQTVVVRAHESAVFSNWIPFRRQLEDLGRVQKQSIVLDLSDTKLIDHSTMDKLHELEKDFALDGLTLEIIGLEAHTPLADHKHSARKRGAGLAQMKRVVIMAADSLQDQLTTALVRCGATGFTAIPCAGAGRRHIREGSVEVGPQVRIESIMPSATCDEILETLRNDFVPHYPITVTVEPVEVLRAEQFMALDTNGASRPAFDRELASVPGDK